MTNESLTAPSASGSTWHYVLVSMNAANNAVVHAWSQDQQEFVEGCLEAGAPLVDALTTVADQLVTAPDATGKQGIRLVGCQPAGGTSAVSWLRRVASHWLRTRAETDAGYGLPPVQLYGTLYTASQAPILEQLASDKWSPVSDDAAPLTSPTWQEPPPYNRHIFVCCGARCNAKGSNQVTKALWDRARQLGVADNGVLITRTLCMYPCNQAPVVVSYPNHEWHWKVTPAEAAKIIEEAAALADRSCNNEETD